MRWKTPCHNDKRIVKKFPLLPRFIEDEHEVRWLETVYIIQLYTKFGHHWFDAAFVTKEDYIKYKGENK